MNYVQIIPYMPFNSLGTFTHALKKAVVKCFEYPFNLNQVLFADDKLRM